QVCIMALKIRKVKRKVLAGSYQGTVKTYGIAKSGSYCDLPKLCKLISARILFTPGREWCFNRLWRDLHLCRGVVWSRLPI
ncbi:MAG: hypothetical protein LBQ39_03090, partial [Tannerellaceae bacterium]|nr:hypothetical protein [Tannerellaceae bacterium]